MKIMVKGLNSCLQRRFDINRYKNIIQSTGHQLINNPKEANKILIWSCAFRNDFCENSLNIIESFTKKYGKDKIIVCGCLPSINEKLLNYKFKGKYFEWKNEKDALIDLLGNKEKIKSMYESCIVEKNITDNINKYRKNNPDKDVSHYDQFIKLPISEGCLYDCIYCAEKLAFPEYKSFPLNKLVSKCKDIIKKSNTKKIFFVADSLGDYGKDCNSSLKELTNAILNINKEVTIGYMNMHPNDFFNGIGYYSKLIKDKKLFNLSLPIQSANNRIIKLMNRSYCKNELIYIFNMLLNIHKFKELETHLIVGFPSETYDEFEESVDFIIKYKPKYVMVSGYMESGRMEASKLDGKLSNNEISKRVLYAANKIKKHDIICNYDKCEYVENRINKF